MSEEKGMPKDFSEMLDKVLSNPDMIRSVASALASGEARKDDGEGSSAGATGSLDRLPELAALLKPVLSDDAKGGGQRDRLLGAIKPYVSPRRQDAIDSIIKFSRIAELMKNIN